jgi:hypothetical protein
MQRKVAHLHIFDHALGIVAVWTAAEIADLPPIDFRDPPRLASANDRNGQEEPFPARRLSG